MSIPLDSENLALKQVVKDIFLNEGWGDDQLNLLSGPSFTHRAMTVFQVADYAVRYGWEKLTTSKENPRRLVELWCGVLYKEGFLLRPHPATYRLNETR